MHCQCHVARRKGLPTYVKRQGFKALPKDHSGSATVTYDEFNTFCGTLPSTTHVVQWGGSHVWKIGGKVFAIGGLTRGSASGRPGFTFKVSPMAYEILRDQPGLRPAPYLASRGMKWIQHFAEPGLSADELRKHIRLSYRIVFLGLPKKVQRALLSDDEAD